jgi:DNA-binding NarL/FixJ family response regulator
LVFFKFLHIQLKINMNTNHPIPNPLRIALVEDNYALREGLTQLLNGTPGFVCVGAFADAADLIHKIQRCAPHVVIMDIELPGHCDGIEATLQLKERFPEVFVLVQTVFDDKDKIFRAIRAGASGYLLKSIPPARLLEAIQEVVAGGAPMSPAIAFKTLEMFRQAPLPDPATAPGPQFDLTPRQQEILEAIVGGKSYRRIAEEHFISVDTVKFHVKNIYELLQVSSRYALMARYGRVG